MDDEPNVLEGLSRMLRPMRKEWDMAFAKSGQEALDMMAKEPFDVIVSDMRMPGMDGATLLTRVTEEYPQTVRFILSGQSDRETIFRSVGSSHQFLAKPCDADVLKNTVDRAFALRDLLSGPAVKGFVSQMLTLPTLPEAYAKLVKELESPDCSISRVGEIVEADVGMTAKILQWVNSAYFGVRQHVLRATQAVSLLGLDTVKSLVLTVGIFSQAAKTNLPRRFHLERLWHHSVAVGAYARTISDCEGTDVKETSEGFTAGILHDVGMLVLASTISTEYDEILRAVQEQDVLLSEAERDHLGATHAEIGAYLLGLWGLPDPIVEALAFHHRPIQCLGRAFSPLTAVHVANCIEYEIHAGNKPKEQPALDLGYLSKLGLQDRLTPWRDVCLAISEEEK